MTAQDGAAGNGRSAPTAAARLLAEVPGESYHRNLIA